MLVLRENWCSMALMKSWGFSSSCSSSPQNSFVLSDIVSSSLEGVGVVGAENCGVGGSTVGGDQGLVEMGLIEMLDTDGRVKEDVAEDCTVVLDVVDSRNLPLSSHCVVLASVTGVRQAHGR
jgi:hypothetical protein